ncbi:hypothetical protein [Allokutzneria oryzae]|uniref:Class I SAM-dependent methyltransferase n=1 Tax=Allokutzneria oryzae TaxID=1378989 RepID=A0ABV5ZXC9_9PSEU
MDFGVSTVLPPEETENGYISDQYFCRMLSAPALTLSAQYQTEENEALERTLRVNTAIRDKNLVAIGGGELWGLRYALQYAKRYVCVEPLADLHINDSVRYLVERSPDVSVVPKRFEDVRKSDLPEGNSVFFFVFNIMAYLDSPVSQINRLISPGDVLFISTWGDNPRARTIRSEYLQYLNRAEGASIDPDGSFGRYQLDRFPCTDIKHFLRSERIKGVATDLLIVYT